MGFNDGNDRGPAQLSKAVISYERAEHFRSFGPRFFGGDKKCILGKAADRAAEWEYGYRTSSTTFGRNFHAQNND